jgi:hypothetical protein
MTKRWLERAAIAMAASLVLGAGAGCASTAGGTSSGGTVVDGNWSGNYTDKNNNAGALSATFTDTNGTLSGSMTITWACAVANNASVSGTVSGTNLSMSMTYGFTTVTASATVDSNSHLSGTFTIAGGLCNGDTGTFTMTKS